jgi:hypothetical protein
MGQVTIGMSASTVSALGASGSVLYGFKAVRNSDLAARPLVWTLSQSYSVTTVVSWQESYGAYTSASPIVAGGQVAVGFESGIDLGQTLEVEAGGIGVVVDGGQPLAISILNQTSTPFTCGLAQPAGGASSTPAPVCACPLYGNNLQIVTPLEKVLLMFSTDVLSLGTVIGSTLGSASSQGFQAAERRAGGTVLAAASQGIFIDLTTDPIRSVTYDLNAGWSWGGYSWAQPVAANANLVPLLIEGP